jgi:hypothetical protein
MASASLVVELHAHQGAALCNCTATHCTVPAAHLPHVCYAHRVVQHLTQVPQQHRAAPGCQARGIRAVEGRIQQESGTKQHQWCRGWQTCRVWGCWSREQANITVTGVQGVRRLHHVCLAVHNCSTVVHLPCGTTISSCSSSGVEGSAGLMPSGTLMTGRVAVAYWPCPSNVGATAVGAASKRCLAWHACFEENTERECGQSATM